MRSLPKRQRYWTLLEVSITRELRFYVTLSTVTTGYGQICPHVIIVGFHQ